MNDTIATRISANDVSLRCSCIGIGQSSPREVDCDAITVSHHGPVPNSIRTDEPTVQVAMDVDSAGKRGGRGRAIDLVELPVAQQKAMCRKIIIENAAHNTAHHSHGWYSPKSTREIDTTKTKRALSQKKAAYLPARGIHVSSYNVPVIPDPNGVVAMALG